MHFLAAGGQTPPPHLAECPAKNASFFDVLPKAWPKYYRRSRVDQDKHKHLDHTYENQICPEIY